MVISKKKHSEPKPAIMFSAKIKTPKLNTTDSKAPIWPNHNGALPYVMLAPHGKHTPKPCLVSWSQKGQRTVLFSILINPF